MPLRIAENSRAVAKDCIKQLSSNSWLLGSSLILERDDTSNDFRTRFVEPENVTGLKWSSPDPEGPIQLVRCMGMQATWRIGQWAYFKSKSWALGQGTEAAAIKFVQENALSVPVPAVFEHYVDSQEGRSYTLLLSVPGEDLNEVWKSFSSEQKESVIQQVAEHIDTLAQLKNDRLVSAEGEMVLEPYLQRYNPETNSFARLSRTQYK